MSQIEWNNLCLLEDSGLMCTYLSCSLEVSNTAEKVMFDLFDLFATVNANSKVCFCKVCVHCYIVLCYNFTNRTYDSVQGATQEVA